MPHPLRFLKSRALENDSNMIEMNLKEISAKMAESPINPEVLKEVNEEEEATPKNNAEFKGEFGPDPVVDE